MAFLAGISLLPAIHGCGGRAVISGPDSGVGGGPVTPDLDSGVGGGPVTPDPDSGAGGGPVTPDLDSGVGSRIDAGDAGGTHSLSVVKAGNGAGVVTSSPSGIDCGAVCAASFDFDSTVTLTASPNAGSSFGGWSGGGCIGTGACVVTVADATTVIATFTLEQPTLNVLRVGSTTATVSSNPAGIDCGSDCTEPYNFGTVVVLTASPAAGSTFLGWSGEGCSGTGTCAVTMMATATVTAKFELTALSCSTVSDALTCTNGAIAEIDRGMIGSAECRNQCQTAMPLAGMIGGCWIVATNGANGHCYCRSGILNRGATRTGGTCN